MRRMLVYGATFLAPFVFALTSPGLVEAQDKFGRGGVEIGGFAGWVMPNEPNFLAGEEPFKLDNAPGFGGRLGYAFSAPFFIEAEGLFSSPDIVQGASANEVDMFKYGGSIGWNLQPSRALQFYLLGGAGVMNWNIDTAGVDDIDFDQTNFSPHFGGGLRIFLGRSFLIRLDARDHILTDGYVDLRQVIDPGLTLSDSDKSWVHTPTLTGGISVFLGGDNDSDNDGVSNDLDQCPRTPEGVRVDSVGCPLDTDGDRVPDYIDDCPGTPAGATVDGSGCPTDSDGDGVFDGLDECPSTPAGAAVSGNGCPLDGDGDGVFDGIDQCPNTPAGAIVAADGCPLDGDADGVFDGLDRCPSTPAGVEVDSEGCRVMETETERALVEEGRVILHDVQFDFDRATLRLESLPILDEVGRALERNPDLRVEIQGHTDSIGSDEYNLGLSERRAAAVLAYLIEAFPGLSADQYVSRGYGETQPIATNDTDEGRQQNRRVEFRVLEGPENIRGERRPPPSQ